MDIDYEEPNHYNVCSESIQPFCVYLENRSSGLDATWEPVRGNLTAHG